ncbi:MAG: type II toxin-antitoxin system MqsR family toxin [Gammaproteobacteria bacterium]|nr:type II toxin-antitoxin system MqsR family toxin [Gammaproteobacteria bacterium]
MKKTDFIKSMTTFHDHKVWQDVYNTSFGGFELYVKFQKDELGYFVISFKER